jgi:hypothetical protein
VARRKLTLVAVLLTAIGVSGFLVWMVAVSARHSPEAMREELLALTPLGTSVEGVETSLEEHGRREGLCWREYEDGRKSELMARYATYRTLQSLVFPTIVQAHYHFDREGKLTDITLHRYPEPFPGQPR